MAAPIGLGTLIRIIQLDHHAVRIGQGELMRPIFLYERDVVERPPDGRSPR